MRKLAANQAFAHAVRSVRAHIGVAFSMSLPWLVLLLAVVIGRAIYLQSNVTGNQQHDAALALTTGIPLFLILTFAFCSIAVNWHRFVFMDEVARGADRLRTDALVWRYFGNFLLISIILMLIVMLASLPLAVVLAVLQIPVETLQNIAAWPWPVRIGVQFILACLITSLFFRFAIKLPAIALDRKDFRLGHAWLATRGNSMSLLLLAVYNILAVFAAEIVLELFGAVFGYLNQAVGMGLTLILGTLLQWLIAILGTTILTSLYGYFVENRDF